jgi:hypothetical protein
MKSSQVSGTLTVPLGKIARTLPGTFPDITAPTSNVSTSASPMVLLGGLARSLIWRCIRLTLAIGAHTECTQRHQ